MVDQSLICLTAFFLFPGQQDLNLKLTVDLTLFSKCQIDGEDFVNVCGLLRKDKVKKLQNRANVICERAPKYI